MKVTGSPLENAALAFLKQRLPALRKLGLGDLADLAAQKAATPPVSVQSSKQAERAQPTASPTHPQRPGTHVDIKV